MSDERVWRSTDRAGRAAGGASSRRATAPSDEPARRRLSEAERRAIRERRSERGVLPPLPDEGRGRRGGGRGGGGGRAVADRAGSVGRTLALGVLLLVGMGVLLAGVNGMFGFTGDPPPTPTPNPTAVPTPVPTAPAVATPPGDPFADGETVVCLDPGHGGTDPGVLHAFEVVENRPSLREADQALAWAWDIASQLEERGMTVAITRRGLNTANAGGGDINGDDRTAADSVVADAATDRRNADAGDPGELDDLQARINICNAARADLLVSIHLNGAQNLAANGYESWYTGSRPFADRSERFATLILDALGEEMEAVGYVPERREANNDSVIDAARDGAYHSMVLTGPEIPDQITPSGMPGAIVETLFMTNEQDRAFLLSADSHDAIVSAYVAAIAAYFEEYEG